ncbi:MAG: hypothetical protein ACYC0O_13065 [Desulfurivibrionaceae bacterium]
MKYRLLIAFLFILIAGIMMAVAFTTSSTLTLQDLLLNLSTEILGIVVTVVLVEWAIDRGKNYEEAISIAWRAIHEVDYAVWVWQGGKREFSYDELTSILSVANELDPLPPFTQNLFLGIGSNAENTLRIKRSVVKQNKNLLYGLEWLTVLTRIRDSKAEVPPITLTLNDAIQELAAAVGLTKMPHHHFQPKLSLDPSVEAQDFRHFGREKDQ